MEDPILSIIKTVQSVKPWLVGFISIGFGQSAQQMSRQTKKISWNVDYNYRVEKQNCIYDIWNGFR